MTGNLNISNLVFVTKEITAVQKRQELQKAIPILYILCFQPGLIKD